MILHEDKDQRLEYHEHLIDTSLFTWCQHKIQWQQRDIVMFGKQHPEPRLTAWFGPEYKYSGIKREAAPFPDKLVSLRDELCRKCDFDFNSVLLNLYRNGKDSMGWHRDNEPELDSSLIASISLGSDRRFLLRKRSNGTKLEVSPTSGSLILMFNLQDEWEHSVPKTSKDVGPRINLTFRKIHHR